MKLKIIRCKLCKNAIVYRGGNILNGQDHKTMILNPLKPTTEKLIKRELCAECYEHEKRRKLLEFIRKYHLMPIVGRLSNFRFALIKLAGRTFGFDPYQYIYNKAFYDEILRTDNETKSSTTLAKAIKKYLNPKNVIDFGCGIGIYLKQLELLGINSYGIENSPVALKYSIFRNIATFDMSQKVSIPTKYDLSMCIEVAEHIPITKSQILIENITSYTNTVLFTSAQPNQGGTDHINEKPQSFWKAMFEYEGFIYDEKTTNEMKKYLTENNCIWWIPQNLMIFRRKNAIQTTT